MTGFAKSVATNIAKLKARVNAQCYQLARELFTSIVVLSPSPGNPGPFADGLFANQWYPSDGPEFSSEVGTSEAQAGDESLLRIATILDPDNGKQFFEKDGAVTMTNNLPYSSLVETWGWPFPQWTGRSGPYRMVALSIQAIAAKYK
jgi:hypothetical protein